MGAPLNAEVEERTFSREYQKHWGRLMRAQEDFLNAVLKQKPTALVKRKLKTLGDEANRCDAFVAKLGGITSPREKMSFKTEQDEQEARILIYFLSQRAVRYIHYWEGVITAIEGGAKLLIKPEDVPPWTDD